MASAGQDLLHSGSSHCLQKVCECFPEKSSRFTLMADADLSCFPESRSAQTVEQFMQPVQRSDITVNLAMGTLQIVDGSQCPRGSGMSS